MERLEFVRSRLLRSSAWGHGLVVIVTCVGIASILRLLFGAAAQSVPFITYFPAIVITTLLAGWRAGLVSMFASMTVVKLVFRHPPQSIIGDWQAMAMMALFFIACMLLIGIAETLRVTVARLQEATDRAEFLNRELLHRVRNSLTIVNSLAALTYQTEPKNFLPVFSKRIGALATGLDLISLNGGGNCDLHEVVDKACAPFKFGDKIEIAGPTCALPGAACVPLTLAIHELCTNAIKYGALMQPGGAVRIHTGQDPSDGSAVLVWQEEGGPAVAPPARTGLGSALLTDPVLGPAKLEFLPSGVRCELRLNPAARSTSGQ